MKQRSMVLLLTILVGISLSAQSPSIGGYNVYYGSIHNHCSHSDGVGTADQAYNYARNTAGLDFFSLADHAESVSSTEWAATKTAANAYNLDGVFTAFWGFEWSHSTQGHVAVIQSDDYCASNQTATNSFNNLLTWLSARECVAFFNHPGRQNSTGVEFNHFTNTPSDKFVGMELWNKNEKFDQYYYTDGYYPNDGNLSWYDEALTRGWKIGASGAEDNHTGDWGTRTNNRMAILATNLTRTDLYNAMKERRFFTTTDKNLALSFKINGSEMGSTIIGGYYSLVIQASDGDGEVFTRVDLLKNGQVTQSWFPNQSLVNITQQISVLDGEYYYIRVKQTDGDEAISSPVHISGNTNLPPVCLITNPATNTQYATPQLITITADASDPDGTISKVEFFVNGISIGIDQSAPYAADWTAAAGNASYSITAIATDNQFAAVSSSPVLITIGNPPIQKSSRISSGADDVEEHSNGSIYVNSTDIELVYDGSRGNQIIGLRFQNLQIPQGVNISSAYIQFTTDEATTGTCNLAIQGHAADNSQPFSTTTYDVSSRIRTVSSVNWTPAGWSVVGQSEAGQRTPDIAAVIQEIVSRPGYDPSGAISIIITGTGTRTAEAYEGSSSMAPQLVVLYTPANTPPMVAIASPGNGTTVDQGTLLNITANASDADGSVSVVEFFVDGVSIGADYAAPYSIDWTIGLGAFELTAIATDNLGAFAISAPVTISGTPVSTEVVLTYDDFESGWGNWTSGGIDCFIATSATYAHQGTKSVNIQDNSGVASSFYHTTGIDATPYNQLKVEFWYYPLGMEAKEDFWLEYFNGTTWSIVKSWKSKTDFNKSQHYYVNLILSNQQYTFPANMKLRFMCDASDDTDDIFIDEVKVTGITGGSSMKLAGTGASASATEEMGLEIYPNPTHGQIITVKPAGFDGSVTIRLMDISGRVIATQHITGSAEANFETTSLGSGVYLIVAQNHETTLTRKLIIR
jgi:hypothetical protein